MRSWDKFWQSHEISEAEFYYIKQRHSILSRFASGLVLEVGCGTGINSRMLSEQAETFCLDASFEAVKRSGLKGIVCDARKIAFKDGKFDLVFSAGLLEHFPSTADSKAIVDEMLRVSKKRKYVINFVPGRYSLWQIYRKLRGSAWAHGFEKTFSYPELRAIHDARILTIDGFDPFSVKGMLIKQTNSCCFERLPEKSFDNCFGEVFVVAQKNH